MAGRAWPLPSLQVNFQDHSSPVILPESARRLQPASFTTNADRKELTAKNAKTPRKESRGLICRNSGRSARTESFFLWRAWRSWRLKSDHNRAAAQKKTASPKAGLARVTDSQSLFCALDEPDHFVVVIREAAQSFLGKNLGVVHINLIVAAVALHDLGIGAVFGFEVGGQTGRPGEIASRAAVFDFEFHGSLLNIWIDRRITRPPGNYCTNAGKS